MLFSSGTAICKPDIFSIGRKIKRGSKDKIFRVLKANFTLQARDRAGAFRRSGYAAEEDGIEGN